MSLHTVLTEKLYDYLLPICTDAGVPDIIFDYDNGVEQEGDFIAIDIRSILGAGRPEVTYKPIEGSLDHENEEIVSYRGSIAFAIDIYSNDQALFIAQEIKTGIWREKAREKAMELNLGFVTFGDILNLTATQNGRFRSRAQFSITMNYVNESSIVDTTIGTVTVLGDIDEGKYLIEETITDGL